MKNNPAFLEKRRVVEKLRDFYAYVRKNNGQIGTKQRGIELNFNNLCNFRCKHCFTNSHIGERAKEQMSIEKVADLANQADELGMFEFDLQGGELTLRPELLYKVIEAIKHQLDAIPFAHTAFFSNVAMEHLADDLVSKAPIGLEHVYFVSGGSEAIEAALKLAR